MKKTMGFTYLCAVCFVLLLGAISVVGKISALYALPVLVIVIRYFLSAFVNFVMQRMGMIQVHYRGKKKRGLLLLNSVCYVGTYLLELCGLMYAPSVIDGVLMATVPIWTEILARVFLKEKATLLQNVFLLLSAGAVVIMILIGSTDSVRGFDIRGLFLLTGAFFLEALSSVIIRYLKEEYSAVEISFASCLISLAIASVVLGAQLGFHVVEMETVMAALGDWKFVAAVLFLGVFGTMVAGILKGYILQHMSALRATVWYNAGTPAAVVAGVLFLKEPFYHYQIICTIFILAGVIGVQVCKGHKPQQEER